MLRDFFQIRHIFLLVLTFVIANAPSVAIGGGFAEIQKRTASDGSAGDQFGWSVATDADSMIVGAPSEDASGSNAGAAYIFFRAEGGSGNWGEVAKLAASDASSNDRFGWSVDIEGDTAAVGAIYGENAGVGVGAVYIFERDHGGPDNWGQVRKVIAGIPAVSDIFGYAVGIDGDTLVVGAPGNDVAGSVAGRAYVFERNLGGLGNWGERTTFIASETNSGDQFGTSISVEGDSLVVGAPGVYVPGPNGGAAYVFDRNAGGIDTWGEVARMAGSDTNANDNFGRSVSISGDAVIACAPGHDLPSFDNAGAAYVFERNEGGASNWGQGAKLQGYVGSSTGFGLSCSMDGDIASVGSPSNPGAAFVFERSTSGSWIRLTTIGTGAAPFDYFGGAVSVSGSTVAVAARNDDDLGADSGSALVFELVEWEEIANISSSDVAAYDSFGYATAISGDTLVIGASSDDDGGSKSGSAYVFSRDTGGADNWGQVAKITASDGATKDFFGSAVTISGDTIAVGAHRDDHVATVAGSVYVFERNQGGSDNWGQVAKIIASAPAASEFFGFSVSLDLDTLVVGERHSNTFAVRGGSAYVFERDAGGTNNWGQVREITGTDSAAFDGFGHSVAVWGDTLAVGAHADDDAGSKSGSAYVFDRDSGGLDNWGQVAKLTAIDGAARDEFGFSIAISGDDIVVGSPFDDDTGSRSGSAYLYSRDQLGAGNWGQVRKLLGEGVAANDFFGHAVAIDMDTVAVGTRFNNSVGVYSRHEGGFGRWEQCATLAPSNGLINDEFGHGVGIYGGTAVVGARLGGPADTGSAYVFDVIPRP